MPASLSRPCATSRRFVQAAVRADRDRSAQRFLIVVTPVVRRRLSGHRTEGHWVTPYSVIAYEPSEVLELDHLIVIVPDRLPIEQRSPPVSPTSIDFALLGSELGLLGDELPFGITVIGLTFLAR